MRINTIGIIGGSGFLGSYLANELVENGYSLRIFTRSRDRARHLWTLPDTSVIETDVHDEAALSSHLAGCEAVINLAGILNEKGDNGKGFRRVHTELTRTVIKAATASGCLRYLHVSALNADPFAASYYLRTKGEGENAAMAAHDDGLPTTVFRPSVIFGPRDSLFNRFAGLLKISPYVFPLACAHSRMQPVYIGDVVQAMIKTLSDRSTFGRRYDLGGPQEITLLEIVRYTATVMDLRRLVLPLGPRLSKLQANVCEYLPGKPFSRDNLRSTAEDSVCRGDNGLVELGIVPTSIAAVVPTYLGEQSSRLRYYDLREAARRAG